MHGLEEISGSLLLLITSAGNSSEGRMSGEFYFI